VRAFVAARDSDSDEDDEHSGGDLDGDVIAENGRAEDHGGGEAGNYLSTSAVNCELIAICQPGRWLRRP
jgi:hypothetical protein